MKKAILAISAALALIVILPLAVSATGDGGALPFSDVGAEKWYYGNVGRIYEAKLMRGVSETEFAPDATLTRAMCTTILYRVANEPEVTEKSDFSDVIDGSYYADAVTWAREAGIVNGKSEDVFDPDGEITRQEFAAMMYRFACGADVRLTETRSGDPADADEIAGYASEAVGVLYRSEIIDGRENGEFDPDANITRAETSALLDRFLDASHATVTIEEREYGQTVVKISFPDPDGEEDPDTPADVTFGYLPEGLTYRELEDVTGSGVRHIEMKSPEGFDGFNTLIVIYVYPPDVDPAYSEASWENVYLSEINGMDAFMIDIETEYDGRPIAVRAVTFGGDGISVTIVAINISHEELVRIAENVNW